MLIRFWARVMVLLMPPGYRRSVGLDLERLLLDQAGDVRCEGVRPLLLWMTLNTGLCVRDASLEWADAAGHRWTVRGGVMRPNPKAWVQAARGLWRRPAYAVPALLTLLLGVGANTAMFSVLNAVVLQDLPFPDADRVVEIAGLNPQDGNAIDFSLLDARDWESSASTLEAFGVWSTLNSDLVHTTDADVREVETAFVTSGFYGALGTQPILGRLPTAAEEVGDNRVVVVSARFWRQSLNGDAGRVGTTITLNNEAWVVAGVMPDSYDFPSDQVDVWAFLSTIPASSTPYAEYRQLRLLQGVGRLQRDATIEQAREELTSIAGRLAREYPDSNEGLTAASIQPLQAAIVGDVSRSLTILMLAAFSVLVIACANLANLALAREARRAPELAVRTALGASRASRMGLVIRESAILSLLGGSLGLVLAVWGTGLLVAQAGAELPRAHEIVPDWRVAVFALVATALTGLGFSLLPGWVASRSTIAGRVRKQGRRGGMGRTRGVLVVSQITLSIVLAVGSILLVRSLSALNEVSPGFDSENLIVASMTFASSRYPSREEYLPQFDIMREALLGLPGVEQVSSIRRFPFQGEGEGLRFQLPDMAEDDEGIAVRHFQIGTDFFGTMGIPFLEGGDFPRGSEAEPFLVLNESAAQAAFGDAPATGRTILVQGLEIEVAGVVADVRHASLRGETQPVTYAHINFDARRAGSLVIRTSTAPETILSSVRAAVRRADAAQPITALELATDLVDGELGRSRFYTLLLSVFAALALALSSVGVYGVVAFGVSRRRREVGIRMAMGAESSTVRNLVVRQGMTPVLVGIALGIALAATAARVMDSLLYGVGRFDPTAYLTAVSVLAIMALAGCWFPARQAAATQPSEALTGE